MKTSSLIPVIAAAALAALASSAAGQVVINEFQYDDTGTDDREFIELYNPGASDVLIEGWKLGGFDPTGANSSTTLPTGAIIPAGGFYVVANTGTLNVNHIVAGGFLENDNEAIVLRDPADVVVDAVACETNKGVGFVATADPAVAAQVGPGLFGNHQGIDIAGTPLNTTVSWGRYVDGRDTDNNGRDFGLRPGTPGTTNAPGGNITAFNVADPTSLSAGTAMAEMSGSFVHPRVIDPAVAEPNNPNAISAPLGTGSKSWVMWDPSGGGNGATSTAVFAGKTSGFSLFVYLDTADLPVQSNAAGTQFRGSEITLYGIGGGDALTNLTDLDGSIGLSAAILPLAETANAFTGIAWIYERTGITPVGAPATEKLYLVDANDGGDSDLGGNTPLDWTILATIDLSTTNSGWYGLSLQIDAAGNGVAVFNGQRTSFNAGNLHSGAFNIGYRENLQIGADGTPDALLRPATFTFAPPAIADLTFAAPTPGSINMFIPVAAGQTIGIEYSHTLAAGSWLDLGNVVVSGAGGTFSDTDAARLARSRGFYRAFLR